MSNGIEFLLLKRCCILLSTRHAAVSALKELEPMNTHIMVTLKYSVHSSCIVLPLGAIKVNSCKIRIVLDCLIVCVWIDW